MCVIKSPSYVLGYMYKGAEVRHYEKEFKPCDLQKGFSLFTLVNIYDKKSRALKSV